MNRPPPKARSPRTHAGGEKRIGASHFQTIDKKALEQEEKNIVVIQRAVRGFLAKKELQFRKKCAEKRTKIVKELLDTERTYVNGLKELVKLFEEPSAQRKLLSHEDQRTIFSTVSIILNCNTKVLELIEQRFSRWDPVSTSIGDIFLQFSDFLKASTTNYASTYNDAITKLAEHMQKKTDFSSYVKDTFAKSKTIYFDLSSYLITPVQRVPRYNLLLTDVLKNTWKDHIDYENLRKAIDKIRAIAEYINQKALEAENIAKVVSVQNNLVGKFESFVDPQRRFVRDGELISVWNYELPEKRVKKQRYFILFNDGLVCARPPKKSTGSLSKGMMASTMRYKFDSKIGFKQAAIFDSGPADFPHSFLVSTPQLKLLLCASSDSEKNAWVEDLTTVVKDLQERDAFHQRHREQIASQKAEQAKAILGEKYTAMRLAGAVDNGRYDSLRRHKLHAMSNAEDSTISEGSKLSGNTFHKMTATERMQLLNEAQENLEKMLQAEKQLIDDTKREINNKFGSMTSGHRPSYKELKKKQRESRQLAVDAVASGGDRSPSVSPKVSPRMHHRSSTPSNKVDDLLMQKIEREIGTGSLTFPSLSPKVASPKPVHHSFG